jgi:hypothetical protein
MPGARIAMPPSSATNGSSIGCIIAEWNACEVCSRRDATCCRRSSSSTAATSGGGPDTTHSSGPLIAASDTGPGSSGATFSAGSGTDSMSPGGICCISRPRTATSRSASGRSSTPARQAAAISPTLWPTMASGRRPHAASSLASAYSTTNSAGWASSVRSSRCAACAGSVPSTGYTASRRSQPSSPASCSAQESTSARNSGSRAYSSAAMCGYWLPCPGNMNTSRNCSPATPSTAPSPPVPASAAAACAASTATSARRHRIGCRPT